MKYGCLCFINIHIQTYSVPYISKEMCVSAPSHTCPCLCHTHVRVSVTHMSVSLSHTCPCLCHTHVRVSVTHMSVSRSKEIRTYTTKAQYTTHTQKSRTHIHNLIFGKERMPLTRYTHVRVSIQRNTHRPTEFLRCHRNTYCYKY